jgi:hypothetical protein
VIIGALVLGIVMVTLGATILAQSFEVTYEELARALLGRSETLCPVHGLKYAAPHLACRSVFRIILDKEQHSDNTVECMEAHDVQL